MDIEVLLQGEQARAHARPACHTPVTAPPLPQLMQCTTLHVANQLAWLDPNAPQTQPVRPLPPSPHDYMCRHHRPPRAQLAEDTKLDLPLWLAQRLHEREHLLLHLPEYFNEAHRNGLRADPDMDLRVLSNYYFHIGASMSSLCAAPAAPRPQQTRARE